MRELKHRTVRVSPSPSHRDPAKMSTTAARDRKIWIKPKFDALYVWENTVVESSGKESNRRRHRLRRKFRFDPDFVNRTVNELKRQCSRACDVTETIR